MKFPELGYITLAEKNELTSLLSNYQKSTGEEKEKYNNEYSKLYNKIKRRIINFSKEGRFRFLGYKKLYNDLFRRDPPPDTNTSNVLEKYLAGELFINDELMNDTEHCLLICDEIHQIYNSTEANNYGLAVQLILDYHKYKVTLIGLSATIINNNKREIIDFGNFMKDPETKHFISDEYFNSSSKLLKPLTPIYNELKGKVIFLEESTDDYPKLTYMRLDTGVKPSSSVQLRRAYGIGDNANFMNFAESLLSPLQDETYKQYNLFNPSTKTKSLMSYDLVLPDPEYSAEDILKWNPSHPQHSKRKPMTGLFDTTLIRTKYQSASPEWFKK